MTRSSRPGNADIGRIILLLAVSATALPVFAQYPGSPVKKPVDPLQPRLRATAVLEWIGEPGKPSASRIVPIAVFDGERYQDGGLYLAKPEPLAVAEGTEYELEQAGVPQGRFVIYHAGQVEHDWFGYGVWHAEEPKKIPKLKPSKTPPRVVTEPGSGNPALKNKTGETGTADTGAADKPASASTPAADTTSDPDRPTLHRRSTSDTPASSDTTSSSGSSGDSAAAPQQVDPDRPTLHKRSSSDASGSSTDTDSTPSTSKTTAAQEVDPDRPTLRRRSDIVSSATAAGTGDRDPDRPVLHRGAPTAGDPALQASRLTGMPPDIQQMAAVSDASKTVDHPFVYHWADADDAAKMKAALEEIAQKAIAASAAPPKPAAKATPTRPAGRTGARKPAAPPLPMLTDEKFGAYELSYSGGATLILTAKSGDGDAERDVTIIAQPDLYGVPHIVFQSVADSQHLDMTPRMRFVDAVDTDGDNRAELIFELRGESDRQFAIYKVVGGKAEQVFATGPLPAATTRD